MVSNYFSWCIFPGPDLVNASKLKASKNSFLLIGTESFRITVPIIIVNKGSLNGRKRKKTVLFKITED